MESFEFVSPLLPAPHRSILIQQHASGQIGAKVYPGALVLVKYLENHPFPDQSTVLELGAGVCGLPSIVLAHSHCHAIATDVPAMLELLQRNCDRNTAASEDGSCTVAALRWGEEESDVERIRSRTRIDAIVGADIVYHEPLIQPLLETLVRITAIPPAPVITLAYIQRFKRARSFLKLARKWFHVEETHAGYVVDYDALTWAIPSLQEQLDSAKPICFTSTSADYSTYLHCVITAAERRSHEGRSNSREGTDESGSTNNSNNDCTSNSLNAQISAPDEPIADTVMREHIDTVISTESHVLENTPSQEEYKLPPPAPAALLERAQLAATQLNITLAEPLRASILTLTRKHG